MNYLYELLDSEDLFRIPRDIKSRFAKLTLSKKKEIRKSISENPSEISELLGRNIIEELLSDDSSEGEAEALNRLFLSKSIKNIKEPNEDKKLDRKTSLEKLNTIIMSSERESINKLVLLDSDITHCSIYEKNDNGRPVNIVSILGMERLQVTENIVLTNSENLLKEDNVASENSIDILSQKISSLDIKSPKKMIVIATEADTVENTQILSSDSDKKSVTNNVNTNNTEMSTSIVTLSSANSTPDRKFLEIEDDDISGSEEDIIVITDTDDEEHNTEYENHVSNLGQSGQTNLYSTLSNTRADRVEAFLHDLDKIPQAELYENTSDDANKRYNEDKNTVSSKSDESIPNQSIEIPETSIESANEIENDERVPFLDQESPTVEDDSPLIQTEKMFTKKPIPSSSNDSSESDEEISISAKFNIKIQFSQPKIILTNRESSTSDEKNPKTSISPNSNQTSSPHNNRGKEYYDENQKLTTPNKFSMAKKVVTPIVAHNEELLTDVDDKEKEILTKLYGNTWQTPEIIKKLDRKTNSPIIQNSNTKKKNLSTNENVIVKTDCGINESCMETRQDTTIPNFSMFHKNIRSDLESTRLKSPVKSKIPTKKPQTDRKPRTLKNVEKKCQTAQTKSGRYIKRFNNDQAYGSDSSDDDSKDNKCFGSSSDEEYIKSSSSSSDESYTKPIVRTRKKKSNQNELIFMDLSMDIVKIVDKTVPTIPKEGSDSSEKLQNILKSCTFNEKDKIPATPKSTLAKRKLYTPHFGNEEIIASHNSPARQPLNMFEEIQLRIPLPEIFAPPLNKQLESVKTGTPIFKLPTPTKKTVKSVKNKEKCDENIPPVTSKSPLGLKNIKKSLADEFLDNNQRKSYGFLQSLDVCTPKSLCHPDALIYHQKFKQTKEELTEKLFKLYNEKVFDKKLNVPIIWNKKLLNTAGRCCNRKKGSIRTSTVELSEKVLTSGDRLRCTLIHELCHAATWIYSGENGHGATWKTWAKKANNVFRELPIIGVCHNYDIEYKYTYKCIVCAAKSNAHSKSKKVENIRCAYCHGRIEIFINKKNKDGAIYSTPVKGATGFAKFVKEKYKLYKRPNVNHGEVMKILGAEFASLTVEEKSKF